MEKDFILRIIAELNKVLSKKSINGTLRALDNTMYVKVLAKLSMTLARKQLNKQLKELNDLYVKVGANVSIDKNSKAQLQKNIKMLQQSISDLEIGLKASKYQQNKINAEIKNIRKRAEQEAQRTPISFNLELKKEKLISDIEYLGKRYSKLFSNISSAQKYEKLMGNAMNVTDKWQLADVRTELSAFTSELKANGLATQSTADKWKTLVERSKDLFSAATLVRVVFSQIRQSVSTFLELDTAMTNVWKVSDEIVSREQFSGLLTKWNKLAQDLSVTTTSLINSVSEWSKIGFDLNMSEQLAELTTIFEKTAEISNDLANKTLVSTAQAFTEIDGYSEEDYVERVETIGNRINAIGNKYAISSEGISKALQNSSAALVMANNDLDEAIAMITAGNKIFQSPEEMGNTLKIVSARLRGQKGELEELGEDTEGMIESVSKVQTQILKLTGKKVNIFERDNETLKSTYDILLEVGKVYDSLSDKDQSELTEIMFGKHRLAAGSSLLLNYEELERVKNDSINASNSMAQEYAKYMESAEASITTFKEKLIETYSVFMSGNMIKFAADTGSAFLDLVNSTDLLRHSLLAIATINIGKGISNIGAVVATTTKQMNVLGSALEQVKNLPLDNDDRINVLDEIGESTQNLTEKNLTLLLSQKQLEESDRLLILENHNLTSEEAKAKLVKMNLTTATNNQAKANVTEASTTLTLSGAMASLKTTIQGVGLAIKASFLSNPIGWILTGITTAVSIGTTVMDAYNKKLEEASQKFDDLKTEVTEIESELSSLNTELETTVERMNELESKDSLTFTEKEEYDNLVKQNNELQRRIDLLELEQKTKSKEKNKAFVDTMNSDTSNENEYWRDENTSRIHEGNSFWASLGGTLATDSSEEEYINQRFEDRARLLEEKRNAETKEEQDRIQGQIDDIDSYLQSKSTQWTKDASGISYISNPSTDDERAVNEWLDFIADFQDRMLIASGSDGAKENTFNRLIDNWQFDDTVQGLQDLGKQGQVTADMLDNSKYDAFIQKLVEIGFIETADDLDAIALAFNNLASPTDTASESVSNFTDEAERLSTLNENINSSLDTIQKSHSALQEFKDAMKNGMTDEALNGVAELSSELKAMVAEFYAGTVSADELYSALNDHYNTDLENYGDAIITKNEMNEEFYKEVGLADVDYIKDKDGLYEVDIRQCKDYASARLQIEQTLIKKYASEWTKYYNAETKSLEGRYANLEDQYNYIQNEDIRNNAPGWYIEEIETAWAEYQEFLKNTQSAIDELNKIVYNGLDDSFGDTIKKIGKNAEKETKKITEETKEQINWIEIKLSRIQRQITNFGKTVSATWLSWSTRNKALLNELSQVNKEITTQKKALDYYEDKASSVKLSKSLKKKVKNGSISIKDYDEDTAKKIEEYQKWYEKILETKDAITDLKVTEAELIIQSFDSVIAKHDSKRSVLSAEMDTINAQIDQVEAKGHTVDKSYYNKLIKLEKKNLTQLEKQLAELNEQFDTAMDSGKIKKGSEEYNRMKAEIEGVETAIIEANTALIEYNNTIRDLEWEKFDKMQESISAIADESDFLKELMSDEDMYDENGITKYGQAMMGLHASNYNTYMSEADRYGKELLDINKQLAKDPNNQTLLDRRNELIDAQRQSILAAKDEVQSLMDLKKEGYDNLLDSLDKIIQKKKGMFSEMKEERNFAKTIEEQVKAVDEIEKQLLAYKGDTSEAGKSVTQQLKVKLEEAKENLEQTQYDKYISDQESMLDSIYNETEQWINERMDNENQLLTDIISEVNANSTTISKTLRETANSVGTTLSSILSAIWAINGKDVVSEYGTNKNTNVDAGVNLATGGNKTQGDSGNKGNTLTGGTPTPSAPPTNTNTNNGSNTNPQKKWGSWFITEKNGWDKAELLPEYSLVDRLRYRQYRDDFNTRAKYFRAMLDADSTAKPPVAPGKTVGVYAGTWSQDKWMLEQMKKHGYKVGTSGISKDELNWIHPNEVLYRASDGGMLHTFGTGDKVFTEEMANNLWNMSKMNLDTIKPNLNLPTLPPMQSKAVQNVTVDLGGITMYGVNDPDQFAKQVAHSMQNYKFVKQIMNDETLGNALGKNSLMSRTRI